MERKRVDLLREAILATLSQRSRIGVGDLIKEISEVLEYDWRAVASKLRDMEDEGVIEFSEPKGHGSILEFIGSPKSAWFLWSLVIVETTLLLVLTLPTTNSVLEPILFLRYLFGSVLVLFLPGYAMIQALYPYGSPFGDLAKFALSFGVSLALGVVVGLGLGLSPLGLDARSVSVSLALCTLTFLLIGFKRKYDHYRITHLV